MNGDLIQFLGAVMPELLKLGRDLFEASQGNVDLAKKTIKDRRTQIAKLRAQRDVQLARKHAPKS